MAVGTGPTADPLELARASMMDGDFEAVLRAVARVEAVGTRGAEAALLALRARQRVGLPTEEAAHEARRRAEACGEPGAILSALTSTAMGFARDGEPIPEAILQRARAVAVRSDPLHAARLAVLELEAATHFASPAREALAERAADAAIQVGDPIESVYLLLSPMAELSMLGRWDRARELAAIARARLNESAGGYWASFCRILLPAPEPDAAALAAAREDVEVLSSAGDDRLRDQALLRLGHLLGVAGMDREARAPLLAAMESAAPAVLDTAALNIALIDLRLGHSERVEAHLDRVPAKARRRLPDAALRLAAMACETPRDRFDTWLARFRALVRHQPDLQVELARVLALGASRCAEHGATESLRRAVRLQLASVRVLEQLGEREAVTSSRERLAELVRLGGPMPLGYHDATRILGRGASGWVIAGSDGSGEAVAIKLLTEAGDDTAAFAALQRESRALSRLRHPAVVPLLMSGRVDPTEAAASGGQFPVLAPLLAMPVFAGGSLEGRVLTMWQVQIVLGRVLEGLAHAHARGVLHLDVKPANILLERRDALDSVRLTDFGVARLKGDAAHGVGGTPAYMAPEQISGRVEHIDPRTDLYAVGATAYELLTGRPPFGDENLARLKRAHLEEPAPEIDVDPGLEAWLHRLLEKEPDRRFASAVHARMNLEALGVLPDVGAGPGALEDAEPSTFDWGDAPLETEAFASSMDTEAASVDWVEVALPASWPRIDDPRAVARGFLQSQREPALVGRHTECATMWRCLSEVYTTGRCGAVQLHGPAGCGTSRLARELCEAAAEFGGAQVVEVAGPDPLASLAAAFDQAAERWVVVRCETPDADLAAALSERLGEGRPVLIVVVCGSRVDGAESVALRALDDVEIARLLRSVLWLGPRAIDWVCARAEGSPWLAMVLLHALWFGGRLAPEEDAALELLDGPDPDPGAVSERWEPHIADLARPPLVALAAAWEGGPAPTSVVTDLVGDGLDALVQRGLFDGQTWSAPGLRSLLAQRATQETHLHCAEAFGRAGLPRRRAHHLLEAGEIEAAIEPLLDALEVVGDAALYARCAEAIETVALPEHDARRQRFEALPTDRLGCGPAGDLRL